MFEFENDTYSATAIAAVVTNFDEDELQVYLYGKEAPLTYLFADDEDEDEAVTKELEDGWALRKHYRRFVGLWGKAAGVKLTEV